MDETGYFFACTLSREREKHKRFLCNSGPQRNIGIYDDNFYIRSLKALRNRDAGKRKSLIQECFITCISLPDSKKPEEIQGGGGYNGKLRGGGGRVLPTNIFIHHNFLPSTPSYSIILSSCRRWRI